MPGSPGFDVLFGDGSGNQLPVFTQAYWVGIEMGLFANPTNGSRQHECSI